MTINEKTTLIRFIDTVLNYFRSGYSSYNDGEIQNKDASALPLAFQVDENDIDENEDVDAEYNDSLKKSQRKRKPVKTVLSVKAGIKLFRAKGCLTLLSWLLVKVPAQPKMQ